MTIRQAGSTKRKQAEQERIQAGLRLIEVRNNIPQDNKPSGGKPGRPISPFQEWLRKNDIAESTARSLMKLAGHIIVGGTTIASHGDRRSWSDCVALLGIAALLGMSASDPPPMRGGGSMAWMGI